MTKCALNGEKMMDNRKGIAPWETKAERRIRTRAKNKRKVNRNKRQKRS